MAALCEESIFIDIYKFSSQVFKETVQYGIPLKRIDSKSMKYLPLSLLCKILQL